jgi:hypothetical protein
LDDRELEAVTRAIRILSRGIEGTPEPPPLIPLDQD